MATERYIKVSTGTIRTKIFTSIQGKGESILLVHGWGHSSEIWKYQIELLQKNYRVIVIDLPGFGSSPPLANELINMEKYSEILVYLASQFAEEKLSAIVGDSLGALLILESWNQLAVLSEGFVLSGCPVLGLNNQLPILNVKGILSSSLSLIQKLPHFIADNFIKILALGTVRHLKNVDISIRRGFIQVNPHTAEILFHEMVALTGDEWGNFSSSPLVAVIRGEKDRVVSIDDAIYLGEMLGVDLVEIPGVAHTPMIEAKFEYYEVLSNLLQRVEEKKNE